MGFLFIHFADGETDVDHDVVAHRGFGNEVQPDLADHSAELHTAGTGEAHVFATEDLSRDSQAHGARSLTEE